MVLESPLGMIRFLSFVPLSSIGCTFFHTFNFLLKSQVFTIPFFLSQTCCSSSMYLSYLFSYIQLFVVLVVVQVTGFYLILFSKSNYLYFLSKFQVFIIHLWWLKSNVYFNKPSGFPYNSLSSDKVTGYRHKLNDSVSCLIAFSAYVHVSQILIFYSHVVVCKTWKQVK